MVTFTIGSEKGYWSKGLEFENYKEVIKMKRIFKYEIPITDEFELELPRGVQILTFQAQYNKPVIWAIIDPEEDTFEKVSFKLFGTGHPIPKDANSFSYIGTAQMANGQLVWHLFKK